MTSFSRRAIMALLGALLLICSTPLVAAARPRTTQILVTDSAPAAHALTLGQRGAAYIAIERTDARGIWYATNTSGEWQTEQVTSARDVEPAIAVNRGTVIIAFVRLNSEGASRGIWTATSTGSGWSVEKILDGNVRVPALVAHRGVVHFAYQEDDDLRVRELGGPLERTSVRCCAGPPSMVVTESGRVFIAFAGQYGGVVQGRENRAGNWTFERIDSGQARGARIALGQRPTVGYVAMGQGPTIRVWRTGQAEEVGSWGYLQPDDAGNARFDLVMEATR